MKDVLGMVNHGREMSLVRIVSGCIASRRDTKSAIMIEEGEGRRCFVKRCIVSFSRDHDGSAHRAALKSREADAASMVKVAKAGGRDPIDELFSRQRGVSISG